MSLEEGLNKHIIPMLPFKPYRTYGQESHLMSPLLRKDGRIWAGGDIVLTQIVNALRSKDSERIKAWGNQWYILSDACIIFEDKVKLQLNSPLLKGIMGIIDWGHYPMYYHVAIDAKSVEDAVKKGAMKYFEVTESATVKYRKDEEWQKETVENVVLLPYRWGSINLDPDQFNALNAKELNRKDFIYDRQMEQHEIVKDGKVIHPAWGMYDPSIIVPLVEEALAYNKKEYDGASIDLFLPSEIQNDAMMDPFHVSVLGIRSVFDGEDEFDDDDLCLIGVTKSVEKYALKLEHDKPNVNPTQ